MAWSTITPFTSGQTDIVAKLNQFRDNLESLRHFNDHGVILSLADDMNVPNSTVQPVTWDVEHENVGAIWTAGDPTKFFWPATGFLRVIYNVEWRTSTGGERTHGVTYSNGSLRIDLESQGSNQGGGNLSGYREFFGNAGEWLVAHVFQTVGSTIGIRGNGFDRTNIAVWFAGV